VDEVCGAVVVLAICQFLPTLLFFTLPLCRVLAGDGPPAPETAEGPAESARQGSPRPSSRHRLWGWVLFWFCAALFVFYWGATDWPSQRVSSTAQLGWGASAVLLFFAPVPSLLAACLYWRPVTQGVRHLCTRTQGWGYGVYVVSCAAVGTSMKVLGFPPAFALPGHGYNPSSIPDLEPYLLYSATVGVALLVAAWRRHRHPGRPGHVEGH